MLKRRKAIYVVLAILICIALFFAVFQIIRKNTANKQLVSRHSTAIMKIAIDDLIIDIVKNGISNSTYYKNRQSSTTMFDADWSSALYVPASMYFFTVDDTYQTLYSYQKIKNEKILIETISDALGLDSTAFDRNGKQWSGRSIDGKIHFVADEEHVLIRLNYTPVDDASDMQEIWRNRADNMQPVTALEGIKDVDMKGDVVYTNLNTKDTYVVNFENGLVHASAKIYSSLIQANNNNKVHKMNSDAILNAYLNVDIVPVVSQYSSFIDRYPVLKDVLNHCSAGYAAILWKKGDVIQRDTIITYDYDDNFEMVEKESLQEVEVPNWIIMLKGGKDLYSKLPDKMVYKFEKKIDNDYVILSTSNIISSPLNTEPSAYFFELYYNYDPVVNRYLMQIPSLGKVKSATLKGKNIANKYTLFEGDIRLTNEHIHPLSQLF